LGKHGGIWLILLADRIHSILFLNQVVNKLFDMPCVMLIAVLLCIGFTLAL